MVDYQTEIAREIHALGLELLQAGKPRGAAMSFRKVLTISPGFPDAGLSLGHCLHQMGEYQEALQVYDRQLALTPNSPVLWNNRGNALLELREYEDAASSYLFALDFFPDLHDARVALASCYQSMGKIDKAMEACQTVLTSAPDHAEAHWNRALLLLLKGEYAEGWQEYEWRWQKRAFTSPVRDFKQPRWSGEPLAGKTLLVHAEQGFGDTIQFCRFIPQLVSLGAKVFFECQPPLVRLMKSLAGCTSVLPMGCNLPRFDMHIPLLSLPLALGNTLQNIPDKTPYLAIALDSILAWSFLVRKDIGLNVGICWSGKSYPDPGRSCPVELLKPLASIEGINWNSLQVGWNSSLPFPMTDNTSRITDFSDTAALISHLDLVVTIDTAVAHLAGALGKKVFLLVPFAPDWRWMQWWDDSPWYPTMNIFRQVSTGDWSIPVLEVAANLKKNIAEQA